jgi:ribosomal protein S18 acetylase RimI-like enzyme
MRPLDTHSYAEAAQPVRSATLADREQLANLIFLESHIHKHLDWKAPLDWLGYSPFVVLQEGGRLTGALACAPDPDSIAWLRLFVFASHHSGSAAWRMMWPAARAQLAVLGGGTAAAIATQRWLDPILLENGFEMVGHIVLLELDLQRASALHAPTNWAIRPMVQEDLPRVVEVDSAAFEPLWRNSLPALTNALQQAGYATVAEDGPDLVGYQLSTGGAFGTHLARLAVRPAAQRRGLGAALVHDLIAHIPPGREPRMTVNTQSNNDASLALYARLGFRRTGERFPVFAIRVRPAGSGDNSHGGTP